MLEFCAFEQVKSEAYSFPYVEPPSEAKTTLGSCFTRLCGSGEIGKRTGLKILYP